MHPDKCETSWRPAGFRVLGKSKLLACCAREDQELITDQVEPPRNEDVPELSPGLDRDLADAVQGAYYAVSGSGRGPRMLAGYSKVNLAHVEKLVADGADMTKAR